MHDFLVFSSAFDYNYVFYLCYGCVSVSLSLFYPLCPVFLFFTQPDFQQEPGPAQGFSLLMGSLSLPLC